MESTPFNIPAYWTDEQALIVFEFIDTIREQIWQNYHQQIQAAARSTQQFESAAADDLDQNEGQGDCGGDEVPF